MAHAQLLAIDAVIVEEEVRFTLADLGHACRADRAWLIQLVDEGVLQPTGSGPDDWQFSGPSLQRARVASRLSRDLELSAHATAVVLDLLDEITTLRARLNRAGEGT
ncbi:chaperone modulator CbpM [Ideonella sp. YS5]|uniref:chaperone modulator CbpM n=1 Tax=Ideonella sp. YS5 TaxID=3453714 RepID=UPI003EEB1C63